MTDVGKRGIGIAGGAPAMVDEPKEPKDRLREARRNARLSVIALAELVGIAPTTVRAHESGQNKVRPDVAQLYAAALNIEAEWLLFGTGVGPRSRPGGPRSIPIVGEIRRGTWVDKSARRLGGFLEIPAEGYGAFQLSAFRVEEDMMPFRRGSHIITGSPNDFGWRGTHIVLERRRGDLVEYSLRSVVTLNNPPRMMLPAEASLGLQGDNVDFLELSPDEAAIVGVVVGSYWMRPIEGLPWPLDSRASIAELIERRDIR